MDGSHSFLKVLVCVLILAPTVQVERAVIKPPAPPKETPLIYMLEEKCNVVRTLPADPEEWRPCT